MTLFDTSGVFTTIKKHFDDPHTVEGVELRVTHERRTLPFSPAEARETLYGPTADPALKAALWQEVIRAAKAEREPRGPWRLLLIWLALPRLNSAAYRVCTRLRASRPDIEAEMVLALLETLEKVAPDASDAADVLVRAARNRAWRYARTTRHPIPVGHIERIAQNHDHPGAGDPGDTDPEPDPGPWDWEVEVTHAQGPDGGDSADGLRAPLRFSVSATQLEGERLGSLAGRLDLRTVVSKSRRTRKRRRIGTLSVRPGGRRR
ncbi:hypothetical protein [Streptomyces sp. NPDC001985]|uniref:hypothetical protein n=1 Tax=Streptomyces sp. NPDC001985 TaxID=3154406 RepID=UPI00332D70BF